MSNLIRHTCGQLKKSKDIFYTGDLPTFLTVESLDRDLDTVLSGLHTTLNNIVESLDLSKIDKKCFTFDKTVDKFKDLQQEKIDKNCDQEGRLDDIEEELNFDISDKLIEINLDCILPPEEGCEQNPTSYTVQTILELFVSEVCDLKEQITDLCTPVNGTSGTSGAAGNPGTSGTSGTSGTNFSGTSGTSGLSGTSGTCGTCGGGITCRWYTVNYQGTFGGTTVYWEDCESGNPLSIFITNQVSVCSRIVPTADGPVEIIDNYECSPTP